MPVHEFVSKIDSMNRSWVDAVPLGEPGRTSLIRAQRADEHASSFIPQEIPPEIKQLLECKAFHVPLVLMVSRSYDSLPFELPAECGICVLGLYEILDVEVSYMIYFCALYAKLSFSVPYNL